MASRRPPDSDLPSDPGRRRRGLLRGSGTRHPGDPGRDHRLAKLEGARLKQLMDQQFLTGLQHT